MIVSRVSHNNLDKLYEAILITNNNPTYARDMGENIIVILRNVSITMDIDDVSEFEAYVLKMFSNDQNAWLSNRVIDINGCGESNAIVCGSIQQLVINMLEDDDIKVKPAGILFNTGNIRSSMSITFTGNTLFNILSTLPDQFFKKYNISQAKEKGDETITPETALVEDVDFGEPLNNFIVNEFAIHFWDFFKRTVNTVDLGTDSYINSEYYSFTDSSTRDVELAEVSTPFGITSFFSMYDDENNTESINNCKKVFTDLPNDKRSLPFKMVNLSFVINCDFYTFLEMFLALPSSYFINKQDLKTIFVSDQITFDNIYSSYKTRIAVKMNDVMKIKKEASSNIENNLIRYNSIPLISSYKFTLKLSLNDISSELLRYETYIREGAYSDNCNDYVSYSILNIIEEIKNKSKIVYRMLTK